MSDRKKILIVDDELLDLNILEEILHKDYDLNLQESGDACLQYLNDLIAQQDNLPDLILMDVKMPGINGLQCCQQIKSNSNMADIPVIFVSALIEPEDRIAGYNAGGEDYIAKPLSNNSEALCSVSRIKAVNVVSCSSVRPK